MRRKRWWWLVTGSLAIVCVLAVAFSPVLVAAAMRGWIWWLARHEHLACHVDKIEAPFLRPVIITGLRLTSPSDTAFRTTLRVDRATVSLNLRAILLRTRQRAIRYVALDGVQLELHRNIKGRPLSDATWSRIQRILPYSGRIDNLSVRVEDGPVVVLARNAAISFSDIETGRFLVNELTIASPFMRQTFSGLRGGTRWEGNSLILAGIALARGLDLQSITFDLDHLNKQRVGCDFDVDVFGGKFRGELTAQWRGGTSAWTVAASASDVSLAQTAEAIGVAGGVAGQVHALKLTFRGNIHDPAHATASVWTQLAAPSWREHSADVIMLGAFLYNRQIDVQQLYVKQRNNELTLNAHGQLPERLIDWLRPDFSGTISADIANLGDFAGFFGASPNEFGGQISIDGTIDAHGRSVTGQLSLTGHSLRVFGSPADLLEARISLANNAVEIGKMNLKRGDDILSAEGKIDVGRPSDRAGHLDLFVKQVADYVPQLGLTGSLKAHLDLAGDYATIEPLDLVGASPVSLRGKLDMSKPADIVATFMPIFPTYVAPFTEDCVDRIDLVSLPKPVPPVPRIDAIEVHGSAAGGVATMTLMTTAGSKTVRPNCADQPSHALQIAGAPAPQ